MGITNVKLRKTPPQFQSKKLTTLQKAGLVYEKCVATYLSKLLKTEPALKKYTLITGPWIEYTLDGKIHYCQPDLILHTKRKLILIECKRTYKTKAMDKLQTLYGPVAKKVWKPKTLILVQCCKNLKPAAENVVLTLSEVIASGSPCVWHLHDLRRTPFER